MLAPPSQNTVSSIALLAFASRLCIRPALQLVPSILMLFTGLLPSALVAQQRPFVILPYVPQAALDAEHITCLYGGWCMCVKYLPIKM